MSNSKGHVKQSAIRPVLFVFCTLQFLTFVGLTVYETHQRLVLEGNLDLKRAAIANISTRCLRPDVLKEKLETITRLKRAAVKYIAERQASGSNPDQDLIKTEETLLEKACSNDTKICLKGDAGVMGLAGSTGQKGSPGVAGPKGVPGKNGNPGPKGTRGIKGLPGIKGNPGMKGKTGEAGIKGGTGGIGLKGRKGETGIRGGDGNVGVKGSRGEKGNQGPSGLKGDNGPDGKVGKVGENGTSSQGTNSTCDCIKKVRFNDSRTTISAPLGSPIKLDCSTSPPLSVNWTHSSEQQCYVDNGDGVIYIERLSSVDVGDHYCTVNNGMTDVVKVIHVNTTGSNDGLSCDFENPTSCKLKQSSWQTVLGSDDHTLKSGKGHDINSIGQANSRLESLWIQKRPNSCFSFWYKTSKTGPSPAGNINIEIQEPSCVNNSYSKVVKLQTSVSTWTEVSVYVPQSFDLFKVLLDVYHSNMSVSIDDIQLYTDGCPSRLRFQNPDNETMEVPEGSNLLVKCNYDGGEPTTSLTMTKVGSCTFRNNSTDKSYGKAAASFQDSGKYICHLAGSGKHMEKYINVVVLGNHSCTFENGLCDWTQDRTDSLDWSFQSSSTASQNTGPSADHTYGTRIGKYLYLEASGEQTGETAVLKSSLLSPARYCLSFAYHMYGAAMGTLKVSTQECDSANKREIWSRDGNQNNTWHMYCQEIPKQPKDFIIDITAVRGSDFTSDVSIDDLQLSSMSDRDNCKCSSIEGTIATSCDFDTNNCNWVQLTTDDFDWTRKTGSTSSVNTGPEHDHTTSSGSYIYIESSSPRRQGDNAELESIILQKGIQHCLTFYYHMHGVSMGRLDVLREVQSGSRSTLFTISGNHDTSWHKQQVNIPPSSTDFKVILQGIVGSGYTSDLALDDIVISKGTCV